MQARSPIVYTVTGLLPLVMVSNKVILIGFDDSYRDENLYVNSILYKYGSLSARFVLG
jgi:hypothetical protein